MFPPALFKIAKMCKQPKYLSSDQWIKKTKMKHYMALTRNEIHRHTTTLLKSEKIRQVIESRWKTSYIILYEISRTQA